MKLAVYITADCDWTFLWAVVSSRTATQTQIPSKRRTRNKREIHIPLAERLTLPAIPLLPAKNENPPTINTQVLPEEHISPNRESEINSKTHPVTQPPHIILCQLFASHQVFNPAIECRDGPGVGYRREKVRFGRPRGVDFHVVIH